MRGNLCFASECQGAQSLLSEARAALDPVDCYGPDSFEQFRGAVLAARRDVAVGRADHRRVTNGLDVIRIWREGRDVCWTHSRETGEQYRLESIDVLQALALVVPIDDRTPPGSCPPPGVNLDRPRAPTFEELVRETKLVRLRRATSRFDLRLMRRTEKAVLIRAWVHYAPELPDRRIGTMLRVSPRTVAKYRLEAKLRTPSTELKAA